ncbi:MAG: type I DNA topoisomerase [Planctomycetaceae bacterium]
MAGTKRKKGLVIVESPAKAKKIGGFLGKDYEVRASMGHVRDLPAKAAEVPAEVKKEPWSTLGVNVAADFEPLYIVPPEKKKVVKELKDLLKDAEELILATDEDREGESIGWHLAQLLNPRVPVKRMVFSEITKKAILDALQQTRQLDANLVQAQETRRVLDRLYGYTLSPLLWKKIARGLSAGRVQSVAVRILVQRELERLAFRSGTYWDLTAQLATTAQQGFSAQLYAVGGRKIATGKDFDESTGRIAEGADVLLLSEADARSLESRLKNVPWQVTNIEQREQMRRPPAPFTTSTLQQEANRKLGMSARQAMQTAQRLYEDGNITYMRTDSVTLSQEALNATRNRIRRDYGDTFVTAEPRQYTGKIKNAQEAHEAIRPAGDQMQTGEELGLSGGELRLYDMIWKRTMATQMPEARLRFDTVTITADDAEFRATGRHVEFPGYFRVYVEDGDDADVARDDEESALPPLAQGDALTCGELQPVGHETKPPARYTEASLVRKLEAEGIGRPSTYASIISTIQDRGYVRKAGNQLIPTFTALAVNRLLEQHFPNLVDFQFTAQMEQSLDDISNGQADRLPYLKQFYSGREGLEEQVKTHEEQIDPREACTLRLDGLEPNVRVGRYGPYLERQENGETVTASLPDDVAPAEVNNELAEKLIEQKKRGPQALGMHPEEGLPVYILVGPFGPYVQLGDVTEEVPKPKRSSIPANLDPLQLDLDSAIKLLQLPRRIGLHPEDGKVVNAGMGRFGPYVLHDKKYGNFDRKAHTFVTSDGRTVDILNVDMPAALEMLAKSKSRGETPPLKVLGEDAESKEQVAIFEGRYGPYVRLGKKGKLLASIPKDREIDSVTLAEALQWIADRAARGGGGRGGRGAKKSAAPKAAKKPPKAKKPKAEGDKSATKPTAARKTKKSKKADADE